MSLLEKLPSELIGQICGELLDKPDGRDETTVYFENKESLGALSLTSKWTSTIATQYLFRQFFFQ